MIIINPPHFDLRAIMNSGQSFRLRETAPGMFELVAFGRLLRIETTPNGGYAFACDAEEFDRLWRPYFDLDEDYGRFLAAIPSEDAFLSAAAAYGQGIRILRQDAFEMLITFIISQRKSISAIRTSVEMLCEAYGEPLAEAPAHFAFPTPQALAAQGEDGLRRCALGYRCGYIQAAARMVAEGALDLHAIAALDDDALLAELLRVPGVGVKVANCVMLFGYHRIAAFPRDVWINRVIDRHYGGDFPLERYAGFAGVVQQYMFYHGRKKAD